MKIAVLSDVHDALPALRAALASLRGVDAVLVAGDLCSPFVLPVLADHYRDGPIHVVFGNNDGDRFRMARVAAGRDRLVLHGEAWVGRIGELEVAMSHFPEIAGAIDASRFDLIVCGHDHRFRAERDGRAWRLNPGSLLGYDPAAAAAVRPSFLVYDAGEARPHAFELVVDGPSGDLRVVPRTADGADRAVE